MGLKKHRLLDGGEGEQNQGVKIIEDEGIRRGQHRKRSKRSVGKQLQETRKVRALDWQPNLMGNSVKGSVGNTDWRPSPMGHQGIRKEKNPYW